MSVQYITAQEVGRMLSMKPGAAKRWLERQGVEAVTLGVGRGLGNRYNLAQVEAAIAGATIIPTGTSVREKTPRRPPLAKRPLYGYSLQEQVARVRGGVVQ